MFVSAEPGPLPPIAGLCRPAGSRAWHVEDDKHPSLQEFDLCHDLRFDRDALFLFSADKP